MDQLIIYSAVIVMMISIPMTFIGILGVWLVDNEPDIIRNFKEYSKIEFSDEELSRKFSIGTNTFFILLLASAITLYVVE